MTVAWIIAAIVAGLWLVVVLCQLGDVATVFLDSRTARDRDVPGRIARERTNELFWVIPLVTLASLGIGIGVDHASRLFFEAGDFALGSLFVLGLAVLVVALGGFAFAAIVVTDTVSYSALRRDLRELAGERLNAQQVSGFRARLARADAKTRGRVRPTRVLLTAAGVLRLSTVLLGLCVVAATWVAVAVDPRGDYSSYLAVSALAPILSTLFAFIGIRLSLSSDTAWRRVYARQRADVIRLLAEFERSSRKGVAGLGDRVARALQILREQQQ
jgi:hypothetical protein